MSVALAIEDRFGFRPDPAPPWAAHGRGRRPDGPAPTTPPAPGWFRRPAVTVPRGLGETISEAFLRRVLSDPATSPPPTISGVLTRKLLVAVRLMAKRLAGLPGRPSA